MLKNNLMLCIKLFNYFKSINYFYYLNAIEQSMNVRDCPVVFHFFFGFFTTFGNFSETF